MSNGAPPAHPLASTARAAVTAWLALATTACRQPAAEAAPASDEQAPLAPGAGVARASSATAPADGAPLPTAAPRAPEVAAGPAPARPPGAAAPMDTAAPDGPRVYAKTRFVWIREAPSWSAAWLGYLWHGSSLPLASPTPIYARGCDAWYRVEPRGFVCVDRKRATLDGSDPEVRIVAGRAPDFESPLPYRYGVTTGAERYAALPGPAEQLAREPDLRDHLALVDRARAGGPLDESLVGVDLSPAPEDAVAFASLPVELQIRKLTLRHDSTVASIAEYRHAGRTFLLSSDFSWVPKDRVRPLPPVQFHGVPLTGAGAHEVAFVREHDQPAFLRTDAGELIPSGRTLPRLAALSLTGRRLDGPDAAYLEVRDAGVWVRERDVVVPALAERTPWGARVGTSDDSGRAPGGRATWLDVSVYGGWLVAYEGTRPVYATLIAPGRGGGASPDSPRLVTASATPLGRFPISGKFVTATMESPTDLSYADVPWVQNFHGAHAIHSAYWHDAWGERVSGGCVNVAPADGRWLFTFTEPELPPGWHGVRWLPGISHSTLVMVHR